MEEWRPLLRLLMQQSGVGSALRWVESQGRVAPLGTLHSCGARVGSSACSCCSPVSELWRLIPELLAKEVACLDELKFYNCMWIETLPSAMQANILAFLSVEFNRFRANDMELLSKRLLASKKLDFWVRRAAEAILRNCNQFPECEGELEMSEYEALPDFLKETSEGQQGNVGFFPLVPSRDKQHVKQQMKEEKEVFVMTIEQEIPQQAKSTTQHDYLKQDSQMPETGSSGLESELHRASASQTTSLEAAKSKLGTEVFEEAVNLRETLQALDLHSNDDLINKKLGIFNVASDVSAIFDVIRPWEMEDDALLILVTKLLGEERGYLWSTSVMNSVLLPKLLTSEQPASRVLLTAALQASKVHPRAFVDAVLVPLMFEKGISTVLCDVISRVVKESLPSDMVSHLCEKLFCQTRLQGEEVPVLVWSEPMVMVIHTILNQKVHLGDDALNGVITSLEMAAVVLPGSLKFANLLLCLVTRHGSKLGKHRQPLQQLVARTNTFMTKTLMAKLEKLR